MRTAALKGVAVSVLAVMAVLGGEVLAADQFNARLDEARAAHQRGDLPHAVTNLQAALAEVRGRVSAQVAKTLPAAPAGWQALEPETQDLDTVGGGLAVSRAYQTDRGEASMNLSVILDNPSVASTAALFSNPGAGQQPNLRKIKIGEQDALLRWDEAAASGELLIVFGTRALIQVEGDSLKSPDPMTDLATRLDAKGLRRLIGM